MPLDYLCKDEAAREAVSRLRGKLGIYFIYFLKKPRGDGQLQEPFKHDRKIKMRQDAEWKINSAFRLFHNDSFT